MDAPPPESVVLDVDVTLPDIEAFNLHLAFSPRLRARWRRQLVAIYGLLLALCVVLNLLSFGWGAFDWTVHLLVPVASVAVVALLLTPAAYALHRWNVRRVVRAMVGQPAREAALGRKRIEATARGIALGGAHSQSFYGWAAVTGLQETPDLLLVMLGETLAIVIPRRGIAAAQVDALRAMVRAHMPAPAA
ncbi:YcxB family protein [Roseomonas sp. CECT 9278]|uniref:YcxB family protein n=1 Tax=Roseomonas sp. CECT 9278 TaxID=2845823 RepID=UPI001E4489BD|nr:YcxB family protein [Roseomonas sp. CECT 9278]